MSDMTTIARPYGKAIFELALNAKQLPDWSNALSTLSQVMSAPETIRFIGNPTLTAKEQALFLLSIINEQDSQIDQKLMDGLMALLAANKRLLLIPAIATQYEALRAEQEKTLVVQVESYIEFSKKQEQRLIDMLSQRLQRKIALEVSINKELLGGARIQAGDLVIDGSIKGQLQKLADTLAE